MLGKAVSATSQVAKIAFNRGGVHVRPVADATFHTVQTIAKNATTSPVAARKHEVAMGKGLFALTALGLGALGAAKALRPSSTVPASATPER
jgi:hypothetical protein